MTFEARSIGSVLGYSPGLQAAVIRLCLGSPGGGGGGGKGYSGFQVTGMIRSHNRGWRP